MLKEYTVPVQFDVKGVIDKRALEGLLPVVAVKDGIRFEPDNGVSPMVVLLQVHE